MSYTSGMFLKAWPAWASYLTSTRTSNAGSGWQASNANSFAIGAWHSNDESDVAFLGLARNSALPTSYLHGRTFDANDSVTLNWEPAFRRPEHYAVYYQAGTTYDPTSSAIKIADVDGDSTTVTITSPVALATLAANHHTPSNVSIDPIINFTPLQRDYIQRSAGGPLVRMSTTHAPVSMPDGNDTVESPWEGLIIEVGQMGGGLSIWNTLLKWLNRLPVVLTDQNTSTDVVIEHYHGIITSIPYTGSNGRYVTSLGRCQIGMALEGINYA